MVRRKGASSWSKIRVLQSLASASATRVISFHLLASQHFVIQLLSMPLNPPPPPFKILKTAWECVFALEIVECLCAL
ncbi:hypothetical protein CSPX01_03019 [Colletotrichum filicis]|nr:hypothetical protein CSPX01_03019 [Colletotrichum filicis]